MTENFTCIKKCCKIKIKRFERSKDYKFKRNRFKAGVFIYDPDRDKVLLVQSRGNLWGPPKGTVNYQEPSIQCAKREVMEETGINISKCIFTKAVMIRNNAIYYYLELSERDMFIQEHIEGNDANGICWIKPDCLNDCIKEGNMSITQHCRIVFAKFQNRYFTRSTFRKI